MTVTVAAVLLAAGCAAQPAPDASNGVPDPTSSSAFDETSRTTARGPRAIAVPTRPRIVSHPIGFSAARKRQMARYSRKHYGEAEWRLQPRAIVEHYTATHSLQSVFATFEANAPDPELGQLPGVCTHFVIAADGTVYQMVPLGIRCRHAVGLNHAAIGIEHVGVSDAEVMGNRRQRRASLRLTAWLAARYGIARGDVIGHNENRESRFHRERYAPWRCQTHGDFARTTMNRYRRLLGPLLAGTGVDLGPPRWRKINC